MGRVEISIGELVKRPELFHEEATEEGRLRYWQMLPNQNQERFLLIPGGKSSLRNEAEGIPPDLAEQQVVLPSIHELRQRIPFEGSGTELAGDYYAIVAYLPGGLSYQLFILDGTAGEAAGLNIESVSYKQGRQD